jgi:hypothetical protein
MHNIGSKTNPILHKQHRVHWSLVCWIRSYSGAEQQQALLDAQQRQAAARLFTAFKSSTTPALESHSSSTLTDSDISTVASDSSILDTDDVSVQDSPFHLSDDTAPWDGGGGVPWEGSVSLDDMG